ncbi:aminotransferase class I/II-fold pyridoxal phosphate-dependent enzyme [Haladaptatus sp. DYSN1]|uniref:aminotransferase class I/II-fold pyridoxal phosphate-dependent enzyme n=1 Tax=unclassified Haladaptatus TaxID=2622732 RepID=UPI0024076F1F|nr:aminotransferase class I/II-fold pyridoxal phosphate-dependent enzyme [Haladaptatus sp. DYSN1]
MEIDPFGLERWFAKYEHEADIMLAESGIRSLPATRFDTDPDELGYVIPTNGDPDLREQLAARYGRTTDEVIFTCGAQEANFLVFLALLGQGGHTVTVTPTYQSLHAIPDAFGEVTTVQLETPEWDLDVDAVADAITDDTRLLVVNNPNNPTGKYHDEATLSALYDLAVEHDAYLLVDEVYRLLADDPHPPAASLGRRAISTASLSKAYGLAGLRFGWIVGPPEVVQAAWHWKDYTTISPSQFGQHIARQAFKQEDELLAESRAVRQTNHDIVAEFIAETGLSWYDPIGVNAFIEIPDSFSSGKEFCRAVLNEESVVLAPGEFFGYPERFRLGFGLPTEELVEGLSRVKTCLQRHE